MPELTVTDCGSGGLLVRGPHPFAIGSVARLHLSTEDGRLSGTFAVRCVHAHRLPADDSAAHLSTLIFETAIDEPTSAALLDAGNHTPGSPSLRAHRVDA